MQELTCTPLRVYFAARFAFLKNAKPRDTMEAPTNSERTGLAVMMFQTIPIPEVRVVPALVSREETVTAVS